MLVTEPRPSGTVLSNPTHPIDCRNSTEASDNMSLFTQQVEAPHEAIIYLVDVMQR
jgi:hypothetical protein